MKKNAIIAFACFLIIHSCSQPEQKPAPVVDPPFKQSLLVDIMSVVNKSPAEVEKVFGKPSKIVKNPKDDADLKNCNLELDFKHGDIVVLFDNNKSAWFDFEKLDTIEWRNMPEIFGLPNVTPSESNDTYNHYKNYPGLKNVAFVRSKKYSDMVGYAIVTVH